MSSFSLSLFLSSRRVAVIAVMLALPTTARALNFGYAAYGSCGFPDVEAAAVWADTIDGTHDIEGTPRPQPALQWDAGAIELAQP